ncbi:MAG: hypothetical protein A3C80_00440 [Candidatus Ryanbacteria bacterium RIFCSPHIGHO2_02_FULL_45_43]|uniref:Glycosyltransferase RgtA/B/C/D-like domain-containing protein n=1 Tax=Candidatus Ryanbacteria bacterium RIFCSPHIGHO2_01_45_13 TaxID=1802112 RepID=A0A1G2FYP1_9BACT|nr:MAG: hypothetical protein A2718_01830 [Candidatus Ryanbacteria bacterium RIFCSPHIGHO2_01_FULL_44_130]OGZ42728.1 MAG: hypothetical protein A2W41_03235 [Candidatus Ryanbacteria bacterium RIFCSPHIGHO2_01_45_13]OGZ48784.1 MAG: hypothetical protein A3C80_00440 [Candidatus Ryanbacteria bacterium RIFCSPHIGHO2_02_FULL_45_43]OGZ50816.1 MAG: hypothetical protein A3E55_02460 [Candidatus Ryanbacteria bacterium RIFCSPHIGHO2_12_FULL_44_20]OGZ52027.1 MAG: hypothetical protein A3A17_01045 [Candidatus Ryanba
MKTAFPRFVPVVAVIVVLISGAYSFYHHDRPRIDALGYDQIGWNLARGLGYVEDESNAATPEKDFAINRVGPGYEFFLAGVYTVFGHKIWVVWMLHALLRGVSVVLVFLISRLLFSQNEKIGIVAAILFGFVPDLIVVNGLLLTETLFIFLLLLVTYISLVAVRGQSRSMPALAGLFFAFAIMTRPIAILPFLAFIALFIWRKNWKEVLLSVLFPLIIIGTWSSFVSRRYSTFILTTGVGTYDLWVGNNIDAKGGFEKTAEQLEARHSLSVAELDTISRSKYVAFITSHPLRFLELQWRKTALYFSLIRPGGYWIHLMAHPFERLLTLYASAFWTAALFIFGLAGAWVLYRKRNDISWYLLAVFALLQPLAVIPIIVETRYRYPFFPFLAVFAAYFLLLRPIMRGAFFGALAVIIIFTGYDAIYNASEIASKIMSVFAF